MAWRGGFTGDGLNRKQFADHVAKLARPSWLKYLVLHNSGSPNIAQARRTPGGFSQRMKNLEHYYKNQKRWPSGPHGFIFEDGNIYLGTPLTATGTHSPSFNNSAYGFEMMADFRKGVDNPDSDGGSIIFDTTAFVFATILKHYGMTATAIRLHKEDPRTTHDCPGDLVKKPLFLAKVQTYMGVPVAELAEPAPETGHVLGWYPQLFPVREIQERLAAHGFNPGAADDIMGPRTDEAIKASQKALGLAETGIVGPWQMTKLRAWPATSVRKPMVNSPVNESNAEKLMRILTETAKWPRYWAAAAGGQAQRESFPDLRPRAQGDYFLDGKPSKRGVPGAKPTAFTIWQLRHTRWEAYQAFAASHGKPWDDFETQVLWCPYELKSPKGEAPLAWQWLMKARSLEQATAAMVWYERPKGYIPAKAKMAANWDDVFRVSENCDGWIQRLAFAKALMVL